MDVETFNSYRESIPALKAMEQIEAINAICYPHRKESAQKDYFKHLQKPLKPFEKKKDVSEIDFAALMGAK